MNGDLGANHQTSDVSQTCIKKKSDWSPTDIVKIKRMNTKGNDYLDNTKKTNKHYLLVVSRGAVRSAASYIYAAMRMVAGSRPVFVIV